MLSRIRILVCSLLTLSAVSPGIAAAATFDVTTEADSPVAVGTCAPGSCTLRQAVAAADGGTGGDVIKVPAGLYSLTYGQLPLQKSVTIEGAGSALTVIDAGELSRVFEITNLASANLDDVTVEGGRVVGATGTNAHGGGILNLGTLSLDGVQVRSNTVLAADGSALIPAGGGIFNSGLLLVSKSAITDNRATTLPFGGGIPEGGGIASAGGQIVLTDSSLSNNFLNNKSGIPEGAGLSTIGVSPHSSVVRLTRTTVGGNRIVGGNISQGAGIYSSNTDLTVSESSVSANRVNGDIVMEGGGILQQRGGNLLLEGSLVAGNVLEGGTSANGAGVEVFGSTTEVQRVVNSTISGDRGNAKGNNKGEGIFHSGAPALEVLSSTISGDGFTTTDAGSQGGNLWNDGTAEGILRLRDSIVAGGTGTAGSENCFGAGIQSTGHNLDSLDQCNFHATGDLVATDPLLAPLATNGGPTETQALAAKSPAIDAGDGACPPTDQRGVARPQGAACDIGAFELVPAPTPEVPPVGRGAAPPPVSGTAALKLLSKTLKVNLKSGQGAVAAQCLNLAGDHCAVTLTLTTMLPAPAKAPAGRRTKGTRRVKLGAVGGTIAGGTTGKLQVKLTRRGIALLNARPPHQIAITAGGSSRNVAGQSTAINQRLTLKGVAPKRP